MIPYRIAYDVISSFAIFSDFVDMDKTILAATEDGARKSFLMHNPDCKILSICINEGHIYSLNGRYSRYFKSNQSC